VARARADVRDNVGVTADETEASPRPEQRSSGHTRRLVLFAIVAVLVLAADAISKALVVAKLPESHAPVRILGGVLYLDQTRNSGAAFSLGTGFTVILTVIAIAVVVVIVRSPGGCARPAGQSRSPSSWVAPSAT